MSFSDGRQKCVLFGSGSVGKSSIVLRATADTFVDQYYPTIEDYYYHTVLFNGQTTPLAILDTAGQDEYKAAREDWIRDAKVFILVYDVTSPQSFREIDQHRQYIHSQLKNVLQSHTDHFQSNHSTPNMFHDKKNNDSALTVSAATAQKLIPMLLVANKIDLYEQRQVSSDAGERLAALYGNIPYIECSALTGDGCNLVFLEAARVLKESQEYLRLNTRTLPKPKYKCTIL